MRIARASAINLSLIRALAMALVLLRVQGPAAGDRVGVGAELLGIGACLVSLCVYAWRNLTISCPEPVKARSPSTMCTLPTVTECGGQVVVAWTRKTWRRGGPLLAALCLALAACSRPAPAQPAGATATPPAAATPTAVPSPAPIHGLPPQLAWDYYPHGLTHASLVARLPEAERKSGRLTADETWSGVIHMTGDVEVLPGATLTIEPGTLVLVAARSDDRRSGPAKPLDPMNPKDPPLDGSQRTSLHVQGSLLARGTRDQPVIFTSDAAEPRNDDWDALAFAPGAHRS